MSRTSSELIGGRRGPARSASVPAARPAKPRVVLRQARAVDLEEGEVVAPGQELDPVGGDALLADGAGDPVRERAEVVQRIHPRGVYPVRRDRPRSDRRLVARYPRGVSSSAGHGDRRPTDDHDQHRPDRRGHVPPQLLRATRPSSSGASPGSRARSGASPG